MIVVVSITAVAGLIWGTFAVLRGSLIWGCLAYLMVAVCFGYEFAKLNLGPVPVTLDRLLLAGLMVAFIVQWRPFLFDRTTDLNLQSIHSLVHHNTLLSLLTETGLVGLSLFLALMVGWARHAWDLARNPRLPGWARSHGVLLLGAFGVYALQLLFHELSYTPLDNSLLFFLAGAAVGLRPLALRRTAAGPMPAKDVSTVREAAWLPQGA